MEDCLLRGNEDLSRRKRNLKKESSKQNVPTTECKALQGEVVGEVRSGSREVSEKP